MASGRLPESLEGPRLVLCRWTTREVEALAAVVTRNVGHLRPWMPWAAEEPLSPADRWDRVRRWEREWAEGGDVLMAVMLDGAPVGGAGLHRRRGPQGLEIGYWIDVDHQGRGLATEAAALLTSAALDEDGVTFVEIHHDRANVRSARVPLRLGYTFIGEAPDTVTSPGEDGVNCTWRVTVEGWRPPRPGRDAH